jgi:uncharacterized protein YbbK (DUF523 family)
MPNPPVRLGISACLTGSKVRYDGGHKHDRYLTDTLGRYVEFVPVCPEVECGLPVPREAMRLVGTPEAPRLVTTRTGKDLTPLMREWAAKRVEELSRENLSGFIFKSKSPSSGMSGVPVYTESGMPVNLGTGLFARAFMEANPLVPVEDEGRLHDVKLRENFIARVFAHARWRGFLENPSSGALVELHTRHKLLLLSHSAEIYREPGRLLWRAPGKRLRRSFSPHARRGFYVLIPKYC